MLSTRISNNYINLLLRIVVVTVLICGLSNITFAYKANFLSEFVNDSTKDFVEFNDNEKALYRITQKCDSLSKINKQTAYTLISNNKNLLDLNNVGSELIANYLHVYGKLLVENRKPEQGLDTLKMALEIKTKLYGKSDTRLAKTINYIGIARFRMHDFEEALTSYSKSVKILTSNSFYGEDLYDAYLNIGIVKASLGNYDNAYTYFEKASGVIKQSNSPDSLMLAVFYKNYGLLTTYMGKMDEANKYFDISEKCYLSVYGNQHISLAGLNLNKGVNMFYNLNYTISSLYYKNAVDLYLKNDQKGSGLIKCLNNLCVLHQELGNLQLSLEYGNQALEFNPTEDMKLVLYQSLARTYELLGEFDKAREHFNLALQITKPPDYNPRRKVDLYILYADFLIVTENYDESYLYYKMALDVEGESNGYKTQKYAFLLSKIGSYFLKKDLDPDKALHYFNRSIEIWQDYIKKDKKGGVIESFHDIRFAIAYRGKSKALIKNYEFNGDIENLFKGLSNYEWLLEQLERISRSLQKENQEIIRGLLYPIYNEAIELTFQLYQLTSSNYYQKHAFYFSEKSKSAILLSSMQNMNALKTSDLPEEVLMLDQNLNEEINAVKKQLFDEKQKTSSSNKRISFFETRLVQLMLTHDSLVLRLEKDYPKYYALKYDLSIIEFNELNRKLSNNEALIEYQLYDSSLYIFIIRNKKLFSQKVKLDSLFYKSLTYLINLKSADMTIQNRDDFNSFVEHSGRLYSYLVQPVYEYIIDKKLLIVPSGILGYLPFELLIKPGGKIKELDYRSLNYLINEFPISYSYSSTLRFSSYFNNPVYKTNLNILYMSPEYNNDISYSSINSGLKLKELPFAQREVTELQTEFGGKILRGKEALKSTFIKSSSNYDILHLAMHMLINDSLPMYSKLVFSAEGSDIENSFLNTSEIYELNLKASMVTLSACNTGTGVLKKGEGIMSLARGFVFAGVPSVVMTLWEVQDESGLQIMKAFYNYLAQGLPKDEAMQLAKLDMLKSANMLKSHPNFWAAYIVTGDTAELNIVDERNNVWLLLLFVFPFLIVFILYRRVIRND